MVRNRDPPPTPPALDTDAARKESTQAATVFGRTPGADPKPGCEDGSARWRSRHRHTWARRPWRRPGCDEVVVLDAAAAADKETAMAATRRGRS
jgi:hypothetical protein